MKRRGLVLLLSIALSPVLPVNAESIKPGSVCKSVGRKSVQGNLTYRCIKSGKKLVWSKGVSAQAKVIPPVSPAPISAVPFLPEPRPIWGAPCTEKYKKLVYADGYFVCNVQQRTTFVWFFFKNPPAPTFNDKKYVNRAIAGLDCDGTGDRYTVSSGYLECRWVHGGKLQWIEVKSDNSDYLTASSPNGTEPCKLKNSSVPAKTGRDTGQFAGFPVVARNGMASPGVNKVLIVGVDFPELSGTPDILQKIQYDIDWMNQWYSYFTDEKVRMEIAYIDRWIHYPRNATDFGVSTWDSRSAESNRRQAEAAQKLVDEITKEIDLRKFSTLYIFFPDGEDTQMLEMVPRNERFRIKEGETTLNLFSWSADLEAGRSARWAFYIHESGHDFSLIGHAPGNGWGFGIMASNVGVSMAINPWEQWLMGWLRDDQVYCDQVSSLRTTQISLSPMEREDKLAKMAVIKLSDSKAIVVESHAIDKWSSFNYGDRSWPAGFNAVMAYVIDLKNAGAPPVSAEGKVIDGDNGNDPSIPMWSYFQKISGPESFKSDFTWRSSMIRMNEYVGMLGDSFTIEGVRIKVIDAGNYNTVEISRA